MSDAPSGLAHDSARSQHPLAVLHDPGTIRARCTAILRSVEAGVSPSFSVDRSRLPEVAERVAALTRRRFPDLVIPYHSRWRHFEAGGRDRKAELDAELADCDAAARARAHVDLTVVSVLLDAGAGPNWRYVEAADGGAVDGMSLSRSEGLGVASLRGFMAGAFSAQPAQPCRVDAGVLCRIDASKLRTLFQSNPANALVGLEGRAALLRRLGEVLRTEATPGAAEARPSLLLDRLTDGGRCTRINAADLLGEVLRSFSPIWPSGSKVQGLPGGDVWPHRWAGSAVGAGGSCHDRTTEGWVPFHKLSQWMSYSLLEPLQWAGLQVDGLDALTGLPEYRNGGLLLDGGVIVVRQPRQLERVWKLSDEFIVEWRALTVALLDELAVLVRERLGRTALEMPLACVLEGGTWAAGREIALERRTDGSPPLKIESDGTVF